MRLHNAYKVAMVAISFVLAACQHVEQIRLRDQGPSPRGDHCLACLDLGQAWALFRMGEYDQVDGQCALVIDEKVEPVGVHESRARDIGNLAQGFLAIRGGDWPTAHAFFERIRDSQLRQLGSPYIDSFPPLLVERLDEGVVSTWHAQEQAETLP